MVEGGAIRLSARLEETALHIVVENPFDPEGAVARRNGLGLQIVRRRLLARYGERADMVTDSSGNCYRVELLLPCERA